MKFLKIICRAGFVQNFHDISHGFEPFCKKKASRRAGSLYDHAVDILAAAFHDLITQHFLKRMLGRSFSDCQKKILIRAAGEWHETCPYFALIVSTLYISMFSQIIAVDRLESARIQHPVL